jgi:hypothetical protein
MGKIESTYRSPFSQALADRVIHTAPATPKASSTEPAPKLETAAVPVARAAKVRKVAASVSDAKAAVSDGATGTALWRGKQDREVLKQRNREAVRRSRAKRKVGS